MTTDWTFPRFDGKPACAEIGGDEWYPEPGGEGLMVARQARAVCGGCEIRQPCLDWALDNGEPYGIWGGLTEMERRRITGRRRAS